MKKFPIDYGNQIPVDNLFVLGCNNRIHCKAVTVAVI